MSGLRRSGLCPGLRYSSGWLKKGALLQGWLKPEMTPFLSNVLATKTAALVEFPAGIEGVCSRLCKSVIVWKMLLSVAYHAKQATWTTPWVNVFVVWARYQC